jgi:superfamily II DNA or RNA helicase
MSVPAILSGGDFLLCSQTGSGKTMAYLLPIVHMLKQREQDEDYVRRAKRPKVLVLGPTKELTEQVRGCGWRATGTGVFTLLQLLLMVEDVIGCSIAAGESGR